MDEHRAETRISIQALVGKVRLHLPKQEPLELSAGQLLTLDCGMLHDVEAFGRGCVSAYRFLAEGHSEAVVGIALVSVGHFSASE